MFFTSSPSVNRKDESGASSGRILLYRLLRHCQKPFLLCIRKDKQSWCEGPFNSTPQLLK